jgi:hypothetical protein
MWLGQTIPNAFTAKLDSSGSFNIYTSAATHVLIDVTVITALNPPADQNGSQDCCSISCRNRSDCSIPEQVM